MTEPAEDTALFPTEPFASRARQIIEACPETPEGVVREVFDEDVYHLRSTDVRGKIVVDVGANVGAFTLAALEAGARFVVTSEPLEANLLALGHNLRKYGQSPWRSSHINYQGAVSDKSGTAFIHGQGGDASLSTTYAGNAPECRTMSLNELLSVTLLSEETVGLLKLDVEGSESLIFSAPDIEEALPRIERIAMEFHEGTLGTIIPVLSWYHHVEVMGSDRRGGYVWARRYGL